MFRIVTSGETSRFRVSLPYRVLPYSSSRQVDYYLGEED